MATGYKKFSVTKTLVLPLPVDVTLTLDEYKDLFGIDLRDYIILDDISKKLEFDCKGSLVLIKAQSENQYLVYGVKHGVFPVSDADSRAYDAGRADATLSLGAYNRVDDLIYGISFSIGKDVSFTKDNVIVSAI